MFHIIPQLETQEMQTCTVEDMSLSIKTNSTVCSLSGSESGSHSVIDDVKDSR